MATYVCSDIHGCFDIFKAMIDGIGFNSTDTLYILGDIIDRGTKNVELIEYIRGSSNIVLLKGNHEKMMVDYYENKEDLANWFDNVWIRNGGLKTYTELKRRGKEYTDSVVEYFKNLPTVVKLDDYLLVHAGFSLEGKIEVLEDVLNSNTEDDVLWDREFIQSNKKIEGYTVICGHTPTISLDKEGIVHRDGAILVDCGCVYNGGKLGCLRLDDMKEFYF